jgi:hypothetical protein
MALQLAAKDAELKGLLRRPWGFVEMALRSDERKLWPQRFGEACRIITHDRQPAALFGTIESKGCNDGMAAGRKGQLQAGKICGAVGLGDHEVEGSPVMPNFVARRRLPGRDVGDDPVDGHSLFPEPGLCGGERCRRHVQDGHVAVSSLRKMIDEMRGAAADVDDGRCQRGGRVHDQPERGIRLVLIPAHVTLGLRLIGSLPAALVVLRAHGMLRSWPPAQMPLRCGGDSGYHSMNSLND